MCSSTKLATLVRTTTLASSPSSKCLSYRQRRSEREGLNRKPLRILSVQHNGASQSPRRPRQREDVPQGQGRCNNLPQRWKLLRVRAAKAEQRNPSVHHRHSVRWPPQLPCQAARIPVRRQHNICSSSNISTLSCTKSRFLRAHDWPSFMPEEQHHHGVLAAAIVERGNKICPRGKYLADG